MNYKMLFSVMAFGSLFLDARYYQNGFALEETDTAVLVTVDTGKKVTGDDIVITHKGNRVSVEVKGLEHTLALKLESSRNTFGISMCTQTHQENKDDQEFMAYQGSSCMQQVMSAGVDLAGISAEYSGTKLVLSVPLVKEAQGKKIQVVMKDSSVEQKKITKKQKPVDEK